MSGAKKVKLRMGMHNRITIDRFQAIKDDVNKGLSVAKIAKRHSVSESTVRKVRHSKNFHEYRIDAEALKNRRQPIIVIAEQSGLPFEDFGPKPIFALKMLKPKNPTISNQLDREAEKSAQSLGIIALGMIGVVALGLIVAMIIGGSR